MATSEPAESIPDRENPITPHKDTVRVVALSAGHAHWAAGNPGPQANLDRLVALAYDTLAARPDLFVFPEFAVTGWPYPPDEVVRGTAEPIPGDGPIYRRYVDLAARSGAVVCGWIVERGDRGALHNTAFLVASNGSFIGRYRKVHPTASEEGCWGMTPGDAIPVFDLGWARVGIATCWDMDYPEVCRTLLLRGADLILHPTVADDRRDICPVRCKENHLPMVVAVYQHSSYALDANGRTLADLQGEGGALVCDVDLHTVAFRDKYGLLYDPRRMLLARRNPMAYAAIADPSLGAAWDDVFRTRDGGALTDAELLQRFPRLRTRRGD